jgi:hypothetical protein
MKLDVRSNCLFPASSILPAISVAKATDVGMKYPQMSSKAQQLKKWQHNVRG